jgi:ribosome-associated heat shock protein Hsp15
MKCNWTNGSIELHNYCMDASEKGADRPNSIRIDKWLWAARFFKTRALASRACELGRIESNSMPAKPAREVRIGDHLIIRNEAGEFAIEVLALSAMRGPAAVAQTLYREYDESRQKRLQLAAERKAFDSLEPAPARRPTKKDRRLIHQFRSRD